MFEGILVRFGDHGSDLMFVIEPDGDGIVGELSGPVDEIICRGLIIEQGVRADLAKSLGERVWFEVTPNQEGVIIEISGDWIPVTRMQCSGVSCSQRDYDLEELRQKVVRLSHACHAFQELSGETSRREFLLRERIGHFIADRRGRWGSRKDFFVGTNPEKAKHYAAMLAVLDEVEMLLVAESSQPCAAPNTDPATPLGSSEVAER